MNRTRNSILNTGSGFLLMMVKIILSFFVKTIFIKVLGEYYLGVSGLFTNILYMLSLSELGISTAINFSLYKPLAEKDYKKTSAMMTFYKKVYRVIGFATILIGIILFFFLDDIVGDYGNIQNINVIYFLYLINTTFTYFISYKEVLIQADQQSYKLVKINTISEFVKSILQLIILLLFKNFVLYLVIEIIVSLCQRIITNIYITKKYEYVNFNSTEKIDSDDLVVIKKNVGALFIHKIGDYVIDGTDNIVITKFLDLAVTGFYTSYTALTAIVNGIIKTAFSGITASLGNLVAVGEDDVKYRVFKISNFFAYITYGLSSLLFLNLFNPFIKLWIGEKYLLSFNTVSLIVLSFYLIGIKFPVTTIKTVAGLNDEDKYLTIIQSVLNLVISIILVKIIGLPGVVLGTIISNLIPIIYRPSLIYKKIFNVNVINYWKSFIKYSLILCILSIISRVVFSTLILDSLIKIIIAGVSIVLVYGLIIFIVYKNNDEFNYFYCNIKKVIKIIKKGR